MSYTQAIRDAVKSVASQGLTVINYTGRQDQLDVADKTNRFDRRQSDGRATAMDHGPMKWGRIWCKPQPMPGQGPLTQLWQGKVFSRSGTNAKYPNFVQETGYGTATGLAGINCRHSFFPFFEGISENAYWKPTARAWQTEPSRIKARRSAHTTPRRCSARSSETSARPNGKPEPCKPPGWIIQRELAQVKAYQAQMRGFVKETGLIRQRERERK